MEPTVLTLRNVKGTPLTYSEEDDNYINLDANIQGAAAKDGSDATGVWNIDITGNAATAITAQFAENATLASGLSTVNGIATGGTGANTVVGALINLGLDQVENKSAATILSELTQTQIATVLGSLPITNAQVGVANGVVPTDSNNMIPASYLPSYVDSIIEVPTYASLPTVGLDGKIYLVVADETNGGTTSEYRWASSIYIQITKSPGTTDSVPEGTSNLYFKPARVLATTLVNLITEVTGSINIADTILSALGKLQAQINSIINASSSVAPLNGTGANGTWEINITGNASTADSAIAANTASSLNTNNGSIISIAQTSSTVTAGQIVDSIDIRVVRTVKYLIQASSNGSYQACEIMIIHDGSTPDISQYGDVLTGTQVATFDAVIVGNNLNLVCTPANAGTTISAIRTSVNI